MGREKNSENLPADSNGRPYFLPRATGITNSEYAKICHEINSLYHSRYAGRLIGYIVCHEPSTDSVAYLYKFEIHEFNEYNIYSKTPIE